MLPNEGAVVAEQSVQHEPVNQELLDNRAPSIAHLFRDRVRASGPREAFQYFRDGQLEHLTWDQTQERSNAWAAGLIALGVQVEDRVAIASTTRLEWALADLAIMSAGAATTTIYPSSGAEDVAYILADSGSRVVFAEDDVQLQKLRSRRDEIPDVMKVVTFTGADDAAGDDWVISAEELTRLGHELLASDPSAVDTRIDTLTPEHLSTIIYTSGTTGRPKGVLLTHDAFVYEGAAVAAVSILDEDDLQFLWLPLSHVFGKVLLVLPLQIGFATAIDGQIDKIVDNLAVIRPTFMGAAPRIFEKAYGRISMLFEEETGVKRKLIDWALGVGEQVSTLRESGREPGGLLAAQHAIADKLVLSKVRERFGGRVRFFISGSAALNPDIARWFGSVGLVIIEGYGLTESSAATCVNRPKPGAYAFGSVGWPLPGTEVKVAEDGELLIKGPGVMRGYHGKDDASAEALVDGWFHTGDIGTVDERGFVRITDRKKDLFKTSGGKYIAPSMIETMFKGICPYVSQFIVHGESRNFASALVTLDPEAITTWAASQGMASSSYEEIVGSEQARALVQGYVDKLNSGLNRWETIKKFTILDHDLTIEAGELTPSLKLRRKVVTEKYRSELDALYS